ncbi:hypothetical protein H181DRAFT_01875 [Streptomyces sp. WMMB 714]|uniref:hypothetical protein n=1 Tax=Streptomyces sp. WMMB 714 TaxID=1286822 RepID=UPI0005F80423|nr:hypothetical protein [Streptomyces sp. WMMB 714]SCK24670.1 hypothetical protein H181DRAFT_01875 [Streptomyces sp. WMMB 714]
MSQSEIHGVNARMQFDSAEADPLSRWQRAGAATAGILLAGAGSVAMFVSENGAGSAVSLVVGAVFILMAITGMPFLGGRLMDAELMMGRRRARLIKQAKAAPPLDARVLLDDLILTDRGVIDDPNAVALDFALLLDEVRYAAGEALEPDDSLHHTSNPQIGDPLLVLERSTGQRLGIYAMSAKSESGRLSATFSDQFTARAAHAECDGYLWVAAAPFQDDLRSLAARTERETGKAVGIVDWSTRNVGLRRGIDDLDNRVFRVPEQSAEEGTGA